MSQNNLWWYGRKYEGLIAWTLRTPTRRTRLKQWETFFLAVVAIVSLAAPKFGEYWDWIPISIGVISAFFAWRLSTLKEWADVRERERMETEIERLQNESERELTEQRLVYEDALKSERELAEGKLTAMAEKNEGLTRHYRGKLATCQQQVVTVMLEFLHAEYFKKQKAEEAKRHRVTLFRCVPKSNDQAAGKCLQVFAREGYNRNSTTTWDVDEDDKDKCRGVAAKIWHYNAEQEPVIAECEWDVNDPIIKARYAKSLGLEVHEAEKLNVQSCYFFGVPIKKVRERWGVLLIDTKQIDFVQKDRQKQTLRRFAGYINRLIEDWENE